MSRHGKKMTYEERLACLEQVKAGKTDAQIAQDSGWSVWVVRKWRRRFQQQGAAGLAPKMGRPKQGALGSYPSEVRSRIEEMRRGHAGWGPITLIEELGQHPVFSGMNLPSRARVAAFLKEKDLARHYERHGGVRVPASGPARQPHDEWELDAQGKQTVAGVGEVSIVNIVDVISRLKIESYPHLWGQGLTWQDYQLVLRSAFMQFGLPQRVSLDHDSAFFDNTSLSPYPSRLHLWLIGMGVEVVFIEKPPPLAHAIVERGHQTMTAQALTNQRWNTSQELWQGLNQRRRFLNAVYPSRSLQGRSPMQAFPQASHSGRTYRPEWEAKLFDLNRIYSFLSQGHWFRETNLHGEFWLGMQRYNAGTSAAHSLQELTFDPATLHFNSRTVGPGFLRCFPAKGLTKMDLMGDILPISRLPDYQLSLPFTQEVWRRNDLSRMGRGTTL